MAQIKDAVGNEYGRPKDVTGEKRMAFTSLADTAFDVCFTNTMTGRCMLAFGSAVAPLMFVRSIVYPHTPCRTRH